MIEQEREMSGYRAWVVFSGQTELLWLNILKSGFRHCSVLLNDGAHWITFDPLSNYTDLVVHNIPQDFDLPLWLRDRGKKVVPATIGRPEKPAPFMPLSCVESVKRLLGIHKRFIVTPWQLYRHLNKQNLQCDQDAEQSKQEQNLKGDLTWEA